MKFVRLILRFAYGPADASATAIAPVNTDWFYLPGFTFLVPAHPGSPRQNPESLETVVVVVETIGKNSLRRMNWVHFTVFVHCH